MNPGWKRMEKERVSRSILIPVLPGKRIIAELNLSDCNLKALHMRAIIFSLLVMLYAVPALSQTPSKKEIMEQMAQVTKELNMQIADLQKQIDEAKKNKENDETIKPMEDQLAMLKKQVQMMGGLNNG